MRKPWRNIPKLYLQWASVADEGMTLELCEADDAGKLIVDGLYPAATIVAGDDESLWLEIYPEEGIVRIPLPAIEAAIAVAKTGVHGEKYFDSPEGAGET